MENLSSIYEGIRKNRPSGAKGDFIKSGGQVVKNVSGYELHKLYIGTQGIFGPIYSISFKVYPKPNYETQVIVGFENYEDVINITKKYLPLNWNIPRLSIYSSSKPKRKLYELFCLPHNLKLFLLPRTL